MSEDEARWQPGVNDVPDVEQYEPELHRPYLESLFEEVSSGNTRRALNAIRNRMAQELHLAEGKDVAQLGLALVKVLDALDRVPDLNQADPVNEIAARRERRRRDAGLDQAAGQ